MAKEPSYPKDTPKDDLAILAEAKERWDIGFRHEEENINDAYDDLKFIAGEQWPAEIKQERATDRRPMLTVNMLPKFMKQITGDMRLNKPAIKVRAAGNGAQKEIADILTGLIRNIEALSDATTVYTRGGESAARCGVGAWVIETHYNDDDSFEQDIRLRFCPDPLNVIYDPDAKELTREDGMWAFWVRNFSYDAFKSRWPDAAISSWDQARALNQTDWYSNEEVKVAWYWVKKPTTKTLGQLADGSVVDMADYKGEEKPKTRQVESYKVCQYVITAAEILEGPTEWAGKFIPIIPVIGEEIPIEDRIVRHGAIRYAKDPQRMYNYHQTTAVETHALAPKAPFILTANQIKGRENMWKQANRRNQPFLVYTPDGTAPPPQRQSVSTDISASMALADKSENDMYGTIGIYPPSLGQKSNEQSGKAILARQKEADVGTYVYIDNLSKAIAYTGRQLVDLIPKIYDTERVVRVLAEDETEDEVEINKVVMGSEELLNDITVGKYDVVVETGPSFSTKRQEAAQGMTELVSMNPQMAGLVMDLIVKAQDWPWADKFEKRFKAQLPPGIDEEVDQERMQKQQNMPPPPPDPKLVAEENKAKVEMGKLELEDRRLSLEEQKAVAANTIAMAEEQRKQAETSIKASQVAIQRREMELGHRENMAKAMPLDSLQPILETLSSLAVAVERLNQPKKTSIVVDGKLYEAVSQPGGGTMVSVDGRTYTSQPIRN